MSKDRQEDDGTAFALPIRGKMKGAKEVNKENLKR
jgi:hypothetical protein